MTMAIIHNKSVAITKPLSTRAKLVFFLAAIAVVIVTGTLGILDITFYMFLAFAALVGTGAVNWKLRHSAWFWSVMTFSALLNTFLVVWLVRVFPISQHKGYLELKGFVVFVIVDAAIMTGLIRFPGAMKDIYSPAKEDSQGEGVGK